MTQVHEKEKAVHMSLLLSNKNDTFVEILRLAGGRGNDWVFHAIHANHGKQSRQKESFDLV